MKRGAPGNGAPRFICPPTLAGPSGARPFGRVCLDLNPERAILSPSFSA